MLVVSGDGPHGQDVTVGITLAAGARVGVDRISVVAGVQGRLDIPHCNSVEAEWGLGAARQTVVAADFAVIRLIDDEL